MASLGVASKKLIQLGKQPLPVIATGSSYTSDYQNRPGDRAIAMKPPVKPYKYENLLNSTSTYDDSFKGAPKANYLVEHVKKQHQPLPNSKFDGESGYKSEYKPVTLNNDAGSLMRQFKDNQTHRLKPHHLEFKDSLYGNDYVSFGLENGDKSRAERRKLMEKLSSYKLTVSGEKFAGNSVYSEFKYIPGERAKSLKPIEKPVKSEKLSGISSYSESFKEYGAGAYKVDHVKAKYTMMPLTSLTGNSSYVSDFIPKTITQSNNARLQMNEIKNRQTHKLPKTHLEFVDSVYGSDFKDIGLENGNISRAERKKVTAKLSSFRTTVGDPTFQPMLLVK